MKSNELEQLKSEYYKEIEKFNRIKELLDTEQLIEFIKLTNENDIKHKYEYIDYLKRMEHLLNCFKGEITSTNNIYVCIKAYSSHYDKYDEWSVQEWPIEWKSFVFRIYRNIEDKKTITCYKTQELKDFYKYGEKPAIYQDSEVNMMIASDFEKENIVLNPHGKGFDFIFPNEFENGYSEVRTGFFLDCMTMSQEESKQRLLKKYNRM